MNDLFGNSAIDKTYIDRLRISMRGAIDFARRRQERRLRAGKPAVEVTFTLAEAMSLLQYQDYRCALTRLCFYSLSGNSYGPSRPSIDRIEHAGPYSLGNLRIVLLGVNSLRGTGTDADMYVIAKSLAANAPGLGSEIAARFRGHGLKEDIPEWRGFTIDPPAFE